MNDRKYIQGDNYSSGGGNQYLAKNGGIVLHQEIKTSTSFSGLLPAPPNLFVGRGNDMAALHQRFLDGPSTTLITTMRGWPGIGKTTLAAAMAHDAKVKEAFPDGVLWMALGMSPNPLIGLGQWLFAFGDNPEQYQCVKDRHHRLAGLLRDRRMLLIIDDVWQAIDAQPFLVGGRLCRTLLTTREPDVARKLCLPDKAVYRLLVLSEEDSIELIRQLSPGSVAQDEHGVRRLVQVLDGLPLALKIAGSLLAAEAAMSWGVKDLLKELVEGTRLLKEDAPADLADLSNQTTPTVAALLRKSTDRLDALTRKQFAFLGVFAPKPATFNFAAIAAAWGVENPRPAIREMEKRGLLEAYKDDDETRFQIHALLTVHAKSMSCGRSLPMLEHAASSTDLIGVYRRLAVHYTTLAKKESDRGAVGYARLDKERVQCLLQVENYLKIGLWHEVQALVRAIYLYLDRQGLWKERLHVININLTADRQAGDRKDEGWCLNELGLTYWLLGKHEKALEYFKQSLPIRHEQGDKQGEGDTLNNIAVIYWVQDEYDQALQQYQETLKIRQEVHDRKGEGTTLNNIGRLYKSKGDYETALTYLKQSLPIAQETRDAYLEGAVWDNIGQIYHTQGNIAKAREHYEQALMIRVRIGDRAGESVTYSNIGRIFENQDDFVKAEEYMSKAVQIAKIIGHPSLKKWREELEKVRTKRQAV